MKKMYFEHEGKNKEVRFERIKDTLWLHIDGETYSFEEKQRRSRGQAGSAQGVPGEVLAPMPGKLIKINVQDGQTVTDGEVVVVMEAMKMEYTLKSNVSGTVEKIEGDVDEQVKAGQLLVKIRPEGEES